MVSEVALETPNDASLDVICCHSGEAKRAQR